MSKIFEKVGLNRPKRSAFDLSHERKMSFNMGELVPCYVQEVIPGDEFKVNTETMIRLAPLVSPLMHRVNVYVHYFFVPNRIIWSAWEDFITGGREGTTTPTMPQIALSGLTRFVEGSLADYLGFPTYSGTPTVGTNVSLLPFRAYQQIYNDYYIDANLSDPIDYTDNNEATTLRSRSWEKDYFTSCLPNAQRGVASSVPASVDYSVTATTTAGVSGSLEADGSDNIIINDGGLNPSTGIENIDGVDIDINDLRTSSALQRWMEKSMRGGPRYIEQILSMFGVKSDDARMQRAEYLGGGRQPIVISEVLKTTAQSTDTEPQGNMAGHGISVGNTTNFKKYFKEHGWVFGIISVLPRTNYQQGIPRMYLRDDKFDYAFPDLAHLGEQTVTKAEIYYGGVATDADTFGYQQRYAEYKYGCSSVHGEFRSSLDHWHLGRIFSSQPSLNQAFVRAEYDTAGSIRSDVFAVTDPGTVDTLYCQIFNNVKARRPLPYFANPKLQ